MISVAHTHTHTHTKRKKNGNQQQVLIEEKGRDPDQPGIRPCPRGYRLDQGLSRKTRE